MQWSFEGRVTSVAPFRELGVSGPYHVGSLESQDYRSNCPLTLPAHQTVIGRTPNEDGDGHHQEFSWQQMNRFAEALAPKRPRNTRSCRACAR